jgi:hypothetical protein
MKTNPKQYQAPALTVLVLIILLLRYIPLEVHSDVETRAIHIGHTFSNDSSELLIGVAQADASTDSAQLALITAYEALLQAEDVGANISAAVKSLNSASDLLAQSHNAFRQGRHVESLLYAQNSSQTSNRVYAEAKQLEASAKQQKNNSLLFTATVSSVSLVALFAASWFGWRTMKTRYVRNILDKTPRARSNK